MYIYLQVTIVQSMCTQTILEPNYTLILESSFVNASVDALSLFSRPNCLRKQNSLILKLS